MLNKTIKLLGITLIATALFAFAPFVGYAYGASATTGNATNITPTNATFNGNVDTGGIPGSAWFEYGTDTSFGSSTSLNAYTFNSSYSGSYSTNISGLTASTTYYFRAVALNSYGKVYGNVSSFTTNFSTLGNNNSMSPTAITTSGAVLASNTAQFNALILTGNSNTTNTWFEWGTTPNLGNQTVVMPISGAPAIRHTNTITGLAPGTAYYFRAAAQNSYGLSDGAVLSLVTSGTAAGSRAQGNGNTTNTTTTTTTKITSTDSTSVDHNNGVSTAPGLGANVFGTGSFFPINLIGWLILLIFIFLLVLLSKHAYTQFKNKR
jgi:phosphodiesterase/alkaline phosphatase D-like protein